MPNQSMNGTRQPVAQHLRGKCSATGRAPVMLIVGRTLAEVSIAEPPMYNERLQALTRKRDTNDDHTNDALRATKQFDCARDGPVNCGTKTAFLQRLSIFTCANGSSCSLRVRPYLTTSASCPTTSITGARPVALHLPRKCCATG